MSKAPDFRSARLNLEQQKKRAKDLVRAHRAQSPEAAQRVTRHSPRARGLASAAVLERRLPLSEAQLVVAREAGFPSWAAMKRTILLERLGIDERLETLLDAALLGEASTVARLLHAEPALARRSLHASAALADSDAFFDLLEADPSQANAVGGVRRWSPLFYVCAARLGRAEPVTTSARARMARRLLELGANPNEEIASHGAAGGFRSVLQAAARDAASPELVDILLSAGAALEPTLGTAGAVLPLTDAIRGGNLHCVRRLLEARPEPWQLREGLEVAIEEDRADVCRMLIENGVDVNGAGRWWGQHGTCLHTAILLGRGRELLAVLLAGAVDIHRTDRDGHTPYALARRTGNEAAAALLESRGASDAELDAVDRMIMACITGDARTARALLASESELRARYRYTDHQTLCWVIRHGRLHAVPLLLDAGLDPNVPDDHGETPLHLAARQQHAAATAALEAAGAKKTARNFEGATPFEEPMAFDPEERQTSFEAAVDAVVRGDLEALRALLDQEPDLVHQRSSRAHRATLLHYLAANGVEHTETPRNAAAVAQLLLTHGADVNALAHTYGGGPGQTTLGLAATSVWPERAGVMHDLLSALLEGGADVNGLEGDGGPLRGAIAGELRTAVRTLLDAGAKILNLHAAAGTGDVALVERLAESAPAWEMTAALFVASRYDHAAVAEHLLDRGVKIDAVDGQGFSALHHAAWTASLGVLDVLLARGAPLEARNAYGGTVLGTALFAARSAASHADHATVVERLCAAGSRLDAIPSKWTGMPKIDAVLQRHGFAPPE